jgi:hypothetical protein
LPTPHYYQGVEITINWWGKMRTIFDIFRIASSSSASTKPVILQLEYYESNGPFS